MIVAKKKNDIDESSKSKKVSVNWQRMKNEIKHKPSHHKNDKHVIKTHNGNHKESVVTHEVNGNSTPQIWFDGVEPSLIKSSQLSAKSSDGKLCQENSTNELTRYIAMDCEMVGTGFGGTNSILARVSLVNLYGHCIYDKFVSPTEEVTDYRTEVSGIRPEDLEKGIDFKTVQNEVFDILKGRILVGHSVNHDLKVLFLSHPKHMIRDTSSYFRRFFNHRTPSLKKLTEVYLGIKIQGGEHNSVIDAQATMRLFTLFKKQWECGLKKRARKTAAQPAQAPEKK